jgi:hypothetical protein
MKQRLSFAQEFHRPPPQSKCDRRSDSSRGGTVRNRSKASNVCNACNVCDVRKETLSGPERVRNKLVFKLCSTIVRSVQGTQRARKEGKK